MSEKDINTEQTILEAAESEFLEKGYNGAKTTAIAKRAGVNHAMIHYYFRTKENLFNLVFQNKIQLMSSSVYASFDPKLPFFEQIENAIDTHFNFIRENPKLIFFMYSQVVADDERRKAFITALQPRMVNLLKGLKTGLEKEIEKGTIHPINVVDLLMNIISLNVTTFLAMPILEEVGKNTEIFEFDLERRKQHIKEFVINGLKK